MTLQKQYGAVLLILLLLFAGFIGGMLVFINDKQYLLAAMLAVILYITSFLIGKKISLLFLELSLLKYLRKNNGIRSQADCTFFLKTQYRRKTSESDFAGVTQDIYSDLIKRGYVSIENQNVKLLSLTQKP